MALLREYSLISRMRNINFMLEKRFVIYFERDKNTEYIENINYQNLYSTPFLLNFQNIWMVQRYISK